MRDNWKQLDSPSADPLLTKQKTFLCLLSATAVKTHLWCCSPTHTSRWVVRHVEGGELSWHKNKDSKTSGESVGFHSKHFWNLGPSLKKEELLAHSQLRHRWWVTEGTNLTQGKLSNCEDTHLALISLNLLNANTILHQSYLGFVFIEISSSLSFTKKKLKTKQP